MAMMKNIRLLVAGVGLVQFGFLIWRRFVLQLALWSGSYTGHAGKISQRIALLAVSDRPEGQTCFSASVGKGSIVAFASGASVTPLCGVLEV